MYPPPQTICLTIIYNQLTVDICYCFSLAIIYRRIQILIEIPSISYLQQSPTRGANYVHLFFTLKPIVIDTIWIY